MNKMVFEKRRQVLGMILLAIFLLTGCGIGGEKARKPSTDLSRGLPLSTNASSSPTAVVDPTGEWIRVVIPYKNEEDRVNFRYVLLDERAVLELDKDISINIGNFARAPKMASSLDHVHLFWAARDTTEEGWQLWYVILDKMGEAAIEPKRISGSGDRVSQFDVVDDGSGGAVVIWEDSGTNNIKYTWLSPEGSPIIPPEILIKSGERPSVSLFSEGNFNLVWIEGEDLYYSQLNDDSEIPLQGNVLMKVKVNTGNRLDGPVIGSTKDHVLIFWSILRQTGLEAGTAITEYLVFPVGKPNQIKRGLVTAFPSDENRYQLFKGEFSLTQIIMPPAEDYYSTDFIYDPRIASNSNSLVVALSAGQAIRLDSYIQILIGIFEEGEYRGYTIATRTKNLSQKPQIAVDDQGDLHLVWQDGYAGNQIYYATTAPVAKARLDRVSFSDLPNLLLSGGLEALTGILLFPFAFPWLIVGLVIMIVWRLIQNDEDVTYTSSKILLGLSLISYQVSKMLFLPDIFIYVPFSAWLDIPPGLGVYLKVAVPIGIFITGLGTMEWIRRRRFSPPSSLLYYFIVVLIDMVLTLAVYGVIFLGEY